MHKKQQHPRFTDSRAAGHGAKHWMAQRLTALALVPLVFYVVMRFICALTHGEGGAAEMFFGPWDATAGILLFGIAFYHATIGMQVVIEDYVHCPVAHFILLNGVRFASLVLGVAAVLAIFMIVARHIGAVSAFASTYGSYYV